MLNIVPEKSSKRRHRNSKLSALSNLTTKKGKVREISPSESPKAL